MKRESFRAHTKKANKAQLKAGKKNVRPLCGKMLRKGTKEVVTYEQQGSHSHQVLSQRQKRFFLCRDLDHGHDPYQRQLKEINFLILFSLNKNLNRLHSIMEFARKMYSCLPNKRNAPISVPAGQISQNHMRTGLKCTLISVMVRTMNF